MWPGINIIYDRIKRLASLFETTISKIETFLKEEFNVFLDKFSDPETRRKIFTIADALIGGKPVLSSGGGGGSDSDFRWDGRRPDEEELTNRV